MNDFAGMTSLPDDWVGSIASVPCPCHVRLRSAGRNVGVAGANGAPI